MAKKFGLSKETIIVGAVVVGVLAYFFYNSSEGFRAIANGSSGNSTSCANILPVIYRINLDLDNINKNRDQLDKEIAVAKNNVKDAEKAVNMAKDDVNALNSKKEKENARFNNAKAELQKLQAEQKRLGC